jgi:hypothetical protein
MKISKTVPKQDNVRTTEKQFDRKVQCSRILCSPGRSLP